MPTLEEHNTAELSKFSTESYTDGEESGGDMSPEEIAALAANASVEVPEGAQAPNETGKEPAKPAAQAAPTPEEQAAAATKAAEEAAKKATAKWEPPKTEAEMQAAVEEAAKKLAQKRIGELTRDKRDLERKLQSGTPAPTPTAQPADKGLTPDKGGGTTEATSKPDPSKFTYGELDPEYIVALSTYTVNQRLSEHSAAEKKAQQDQAAAVHDAELVQKREASIAAGNKDYPDFQTAVVDTASRDEWPLTPTLGELIFDSAHGHHVAYYLATHPDEASELAKQSPTKQAAWFGKVEAAFEGKAPSQPAKAPAAKTPVKAPQARPPIKEPAGAQTTHDVGTDTQDFAAFERLVREQNRR
jgi:hypothetical protein